MAKKLPPMVPESRQWTNSEEIDRAVAKLERRIEELKALDVHAAVTVDTGKDRAAISNVKDSIREIFGPTSPEFLEYEGARLWSGPMYVGMDDSEVIQATHRGRVALIGRIEGLVGRLKEKQTDLAASGNPTPKAFLDYLNLHPRIADVAGDLFKDGYPWEAVFAASKALVNFVKEKSGRHDLDGATLMRTVFSKNNPVLTFNELKDQTDTDEQEGMMHLFEGVVLGIRNPGGHSFPEGPEQRAVEYLSLICLLAYRTQESKRRRIG